MRQLAHRVGQRFGEQHAQRRIELVDVADRVDARRVLGHARAVAEAGRAGVAGARDDLREAMAHGCASVRERGAGSIREAARAASDAPCTQHRARTPACVMRRRAQRASLDDPPHGHARTILRTRPRPQRRQLRAAVAAVADRAHRVHVSRSSSRSSTASAATRGRETYARCRRLASALASAGIGAGDTVARDGSPTRRR